MTIAATCISCILIEALYRRSQKAGEETASAVILDGDVHWERVGRSMPLASVFVGALSSLLGLDSGELISPMFLQLGLFPQVSLVAIATAVMFYGISRRHT